MKHFKIVAAAALALSLGGCVTNSDGSINWGGSFTQFSNGLDVFNQKVNTYAPIVGKDLVEFANIVYQVECSPARQPVSGVAQNVLKIVAPSSTAADKLVTRLQQNDDVANQICPLVQSIQASVAAVPQTATPSQVIATTPSS